MSILDVLEEHPTLGLIRKGSKATVKYALEYTHRGGTWASELFAEDDRDAAEKVESMKNSLVLLGGPVETIPWTPNVYQSIRLSSDG